MTSETQARFEKEVRPKDTVYLYHGMEFKDSLNFPGGMPAEIIPRANFLWLLAETNRLVSLDRPMPRYGGLLAKRQAGKQWHLMDERLQKATTKRWPATIRYHLILGDSHALSMYQPGARIFRNDGMTLHHATRHLLELVQEGAEGWDRVRKLTLYFGNIDVRHHLMREGRSALDLVDDYIEVVKKVKKTFDVKTIEVVAPLPIEDESRRLPKTGWYKGTPFYGAWSQRNQLVTMMTAALSKAQGRHYRLVAHPRHWQNTAGQLSFDVMEKPQSVHIRPDEYRFIREGGSWTCANW